MGENYNIGSGKIVRNLDLIKKIIIYCKKFLQSESQIEYVKDRPGHDKRYALNSNKIRRHLGWTAKYNFDTGIENTIMWYINNKQWIKKIINKKYSKRIGLKL